MTDEDEDRARWERIRQQLEDGRRERRIEVNFWREHPYPQDMGRIMAAQFVANITETVTLLEQGGNSERLSELYDDVPPHWTVEPFFTEEQKAIIKAIYDRVDKLMGNDGAEDA